MASTQGPSESCLSPSYFWHLQYISKAGSHQKSTQLLLTATTFQLPLDTVCWGRQSFSQTRSVVMQSYSQLLRRSIQALSPDTSDASRTATQSMDCLRTAASEALEHFLGERTIFPGLQTITSQATCWTLFFRDGPDYNFNLPLYFLEASSRARENKLKLSAHEKLNSQNNHSQLPWLQKEPKKYIFLAFYLRRVLHRWTHVYLLAWRFLQYRSVYERRHHAALNNRGLKATWEDSPNQEVCLGIELRASMGAKGLCAIIQFQCC